MYPRNVYANLLVEKYYAATESGSSVADGIKRKISQKYEAHTYKFLRSRASITQNGSGHRKYKFSYG